MERRLLPIYAIMKYIEYYKEALNITISDLASQPILLSVIRHPVKQDIQWEKKKKMKDEASFFFPIGNWLVHEKWSVWQMVGCKRLKIKRPSMMSAEKKSGFRGHCEKHLFSLYYCTQPSPRRPGTCLRKVNSFYSMQLKYWNGPVMCNWLIFQNVIQSVRCFQLSVILNL